MALKDMIGENVECRTEGAKFDPSVRAGYIFNSGIAGIEKADAILLVGTNPRWEGAMVNARILKTWRANKRLKVGVIGENHDLTYPTTYIGAGPSSLENLGAFGDVLKNAKNPIMIVGMGAFTREDGFDVHGLCRRFRNSSRWDSIFCIRRRHVCCGA